MRVLYIIDYVTQGGATHSFLEMVYAMKMIGVDPVVCTSRKDLINEQLDQMGIDNFSIGHNNVLYPFNFIGLLWPLKYIKHAVSYFIKEIVAVHRIKQRDWSTIDLIHTNSARNDIGCYLSKKYGIPHIMHIREFADADFNCISFRHNYIKLFNRYTTQFIAISDAVKYHWVNKGIEEGKICTIYNGIHYEDIAQSSDNDKKEQNLRLLIAGGVTPTKGQHIAVEAIGLLPSEIRDKISLDIAGWAENDYVEVIKKKATEKEIEQNIKFLGTVNQLHERLGDYQIGLMCSKAEGFGRVTAEYMHARMGIIASNTGANPELIQDGENGLLFKSGDSRSLAACIVKLFNDRELLIKLSNAAQEKARRLYTQQKNADSIYSVYKKINQTSQKEKKEKVQKDSSSMC